MQYSLIDFLKMRGGRLSEREAAAVTWKVARGIDHIHSCGIVHFDLKPANILVNIDKESDCITSVKIADFGVSKSKRDNYSTANDIPGTLSFMAPEMLRVNSTFDHRIEAWSLGVMLHQLLTGKLPFTSKSERTLARKIVLDDIDFGEDIFENISIESLDLVENLLIKDPEQRATIQDVLVNSWIQD